MLPLLYLCLGALMSALLARQSSGEEQLEIANLTDTRVELVYADRPSGRGLQVVSAQDSLYISTLDGRSLVAAGEANEDSLRLFSLGRNMFIQAKAGLGKSRDFAVPDAYTDTLNNANEAVLRDLLHILNTSETTQDSDSRLWDSLLTILRYPEVEMLQRTVAVLGNAGVTGVEYPSILPFYMTALLLDQLVQRSNLSSCRGLLDGAEERQGRVTEDCLSECPPCPYQECLGLCGYGCKCWKWVCGDCCYHLGCYEHDICCREKFVRTACLFPFGFKCESGYNCN